ncbi:hypothetical protein RHMOL_Rhmol12G0185600 [Rhododendron molle]|uniref:Uncharacterized protein n=1 Tax=Rhododendron molle TaxID=49168 RepID=A0ACC0LKZ5_RHOML|nr:hypothetical protein RHMOL_Rhmol12G0185600 [Rhododendron molle]
MQSTFRQNYLFGVFQCTASCHPQKFLVDYTNALPPPLNVLKAFRKSSINGITKGKGRYRFQPSGFECPALEHMPCPSLAH